MTFVDSSKQHVQANVPPIFCPISLPCGRLVRNRLVKVAMYEHLASFFGGPPNSYHLSLYSKWARNDWAIVVTGNVQVCPSHLTLGRDLVLPECITEDTLLPFRLLAAAIHERSLQRNVELNQDNPTEGLPPTLAIMQLSHAGRQSTNLLGGRYPFVPPLAPSAIAVGHGSLETGFLSRAFHRLLFQTPREMSASDIDDVVRAFVKGADVAHQSGFDGVQLHVAHGYLLAQFLSPKTNTRTDTYTSTALALLQRIVFAIRATVPTDFVLGVKLNAADFVGNSTDVDREQNTKATDSLALIHICTIAQWNNIDFIEISGGDYEDPKFMASNVSSSTSPRQALFSDFSFRTLKILQSLPQPTPLVLLTGGLRTPALLHSALAAKHTHLLGIGRGSVLCPNLPEILRDRASDDHKPFVPGPDMHVTARWPFTWLLKVKLVGAGVEMARYVVGIRNLASETSEKKVTSEIGGVEAILRMWLWIGWGGATIGKFAVVGFSVIIGVITLWLSY